MLASQLLTHNYPTVDADDSILFALQLIEDFDIFHIAVTEHGGAEKGHKFIGLLSKDDLLDADGTMPVSALSRSMLKTATKNDEHFLLALRLASQHGLSIVPVVNNEHEWLGAIACSELLKAASAFTGADEQGAVIVLEMERKNFSFGEISRLVETNDAYITQLNSYVESETGLVIATIKINKLEVSDIIATFQRYEYSVRYFIGEEHYENELRSNYENLVAYLKV